MGLFGSKSNPYDAAAEYMDEIPGVQQEYLGAYNQAGHRLLKPLIGGYGLMATHPGDVQQAMGQSYQQSPGYQWNLDQQLEAQNQAMAAGGMSGSPESQQFAEQTASHYADNDFNNYLNNQMRIASAGVGGLQGIQNQGFKASNNIDQLMTDYYYNRANLAGAQAQNRNNMIMGGLGLGAGLGLGMYNASKSEPAMSTMDMMALGMI